MSALLLALLGCRWPTEAADPDVLVDPPADSDPPVIESDPPVEPPEDPWSYWPPEDGTRPTCAPRELQWRADNAARIEVWLGMIGVSWHQNSGVRSWSGSEKICASVDSGYTYFSFDFHPMTLPSARWNALATGPKSAELIIIDADGNVNSRYGSRECIDDSVKVAMGRCWIDSENEITCVDLSLGGCHKTGRDSRAYLPPPGPWQLNPLAFFAGQALPDTVTRVTSPIPCILDTNGRLWCGPGDAPYLEPFQDPARCWVELAIDPLKACGIDGEGVVECHYVEQTVIPYVPPPADLRISHLKLGNEMCGLDEDNIIRCWSVDGATQRPPTDEPFVDFAFSGWDGCGLRPDGTIRCWGDPTNPIVWLNPDDPLPEPDCPWWP